MNAPLSTLTDEQLCEVIAKRAGSPAEASMASAAFDDLYRRYARWLLSYLVSRVKKADLEDIAQVVWQRVWERMETGFRGGKFQVWMFFIARNYLIDLSRRPAMDLLSTDSALADARDNRPEASMEQTEQQNQLERCLGKLNRQAAAVVRLRLNGESYEEICQKLSIPKSRAYKLLQQARETLTEWMTGTATAAVGA